MAEASAPVFPFNSLSCTQTPFQFPKVAKVSDLPEYKTSTIRLIGDKPGPGRILQRASKDGQLIEENTQITLLFEGQTFNISDTILHFPGMHRLPGSDSPPAGELHIYFRVNKPSKQQMVRDDVCVVIPIKVGVGKGVDYFSYLNRDAAVRTEYLPPLTSILTDKTPVILYKGKDLKNRAAGLPRPDTQCLPNSYAIQHIILQNPVNIRAKDVERIKAINEYIELEPPNDPISVADLRRFCAIYTNPGLRIGSFTQAPTDLPAGVKRMADMKCRPIDAKKDIKGDKIIINENAREIFLPDELYGKRKLEDENGVPGAGSGSSIKPGQFEDILAIPIGGAIGLTFTAFIVWGINSVVWRMNPLPIPT
jgi:hypothetical protein